MKKPTFLSKNKEKKPKQTKPKKEKKVKQKSQTWNKFSTAYKGICYRIIGKYLPKNRNYEDLNAKIQMADMNFVAEIYISVILITTFLTTTASLIGFYFLFNHLIQIESWLQYTIILTSLIAAFTAFYLPMVMKSKISNRQQHIDQQLPFSLSQLAILASTGLTPIKIFRHMTQNEESDITKEYKKIIYKADMEGKDLITALGETAKTTPSNAFRETLWDVANMIHQGGDLDIYLRDKADATMQLKRDIQKEFIEKLTGYSEMYSSLVLIGVLFIGIAAFLLDATGSTAGGLTAETLFLLLTFLIIPVSVISINIIISMAYSKSG